jgi:hypothetical protein
LPWEITTRGNPVPATAPFAATVWVNSSSGWGEAGALEGYQMAISIAGPAPSGMLRRWKPTELSWAAAAPTRLNDINRTAARACSRRMTHSLRSGNPIIPQRPPRAPGV